MPLPIHDRAVIEDGVDGMRRLRFERMTGAFLHVHLNPEPRRGWNLPKALDHLDRSVHDIKIPGDGPDHFFLDHMVSRRHGEVQRGDAGNRADRIVWGDPDAGGFSHGGDFFRLP
jgi:hypothetical protein